MQVTCVLCGLPILNLRGQLVSAIHGDGRYCRCITVQIYFIKNTTAANIGRLEPLPSMYQKTPVPAAFLTAFEHEDLDPGGEQHAIL